MSDRSTLAPLVLEAAPLRRKITGVLRQAIESGKLPPGKRLVEKDICSELNVSRTSLREALRELEADGLVAHRPNGGLVVTRITRAEAENIYQVRAHLEALVAEQFVARAAPEDVQQLRSRTEELRAAYDSSDLEQMLEAKRRFYECLCFGANNQIVLDILRKLNSRVTRLRGSSLSQRDRRPASIAEIETLVLAIERKDGRSAKRAALTHVRNAGAVALASLPDEDTE